MYSFSTLVNSVSLDQLLNRVKLLKLVFCSESETPSMKEAFDCIMNVINTLGDADQLAEQDVEAILYDQTEGIDDMENAMHPFGSYFKMQLDKTQVNGSDETRNSLYNPGWFQRLLDKWLPMAPFWTSLLLGGQLHSPLPTLLIYSFIFTNRRYKSPQRSLYSDRGTHPGM